MHYLLKWIKFSVTKNKPLKNTGKMAKNTGKVREKSGNFVSPEKWEPCICINGQMIIILSRSVVNISPGDGIEQSRAVLNDQSIWRSGDAQNPNVQSKSFKILQQQLGH